MKKSLVFCLVFILIAAAAVFADLEFSLSGDASVTWGIDLDNTATGFVNSASSSLSVTIVSKQSKEKGADDAVYGYIKISDFELKLSPSSVSGSKGDVTAKVMAKPLYVTIYNKPGIAPNKASIPGYLGVVTTKDGVVGDVDSFGSGTTGGIAIGVDTDVVDVELQFISYGSYINTDLNTNNDYAVGLTVSVGAVEGLTLEAAAGYYIGDGGTNMDASVKAGYAIGLGGDMALKPVVGFDMDYETDLNMEASVGLYLKLAKGDYDQSVDFKVIGPEKTVTPGLFVGFLLSIPASGDLNGNLVASFYEPSGDDGVLPIVGAGVFFELANLLVGTMDMGVGVSLDATINGIKPYAAVKATGFMTTLALLAEVGVEIPVFANTTLTLDWTSGDLAADPAEKGNITLKVKISY